MTILPLVLTVLTKNCKLELFKITKWLIKAFSKAISADNDVLPTKARHTPHVLWMAPPTHKNFGNYNNDQRLIQTECLQEIIVNVKHVCTQTSEIMGCEHFKFFPV